MDCQIRTQSNGVSTAAHGDVNGGHLGVTIPANPNDALPVYPTTPEQPSEPNYPVFPIAPEGGRPTWPNGGVCTECTICPGCGNNSTNVAQVRFLHAALNTPAVNIAIGNQNIVPGLTYSNLSAYTSAYSGFRTITVTTARTPRMVLVQKTFPIRSGDVYTFALINTVSGVDLLQISDTSCNNDFTDLGCMRVVALSPNAPALDVRLSDGRLVYSDIQYKEVTPFKRIRPGSYNFLVSETMPQAVPLEVDIETIDDFSIMQSRIFPDYVPDPLLTFSLQVKANVQYTVYLIGRVGGTPSFSTLLVENY